MPLMHCVHWYSENKNVFSDRPKTAAVYDGSRKSLRSEFQNIRPATKKARRPYVVSRWDGITSWWPAAERRCCLEAVLETGTQHAARYRGAEPYRHRHVITPSLFVLDTLGYVKPVEFSMHQLPQTAVELPCTTDYTSCRIQHSLQLVGTQVLQTHRQSDRQTDRQTDKIYKRIIRSFYSDHRRCLQFPIIHDVLWQTTDIIADKVFIA